VIGIAVVAIVSYVAGAIPFSYIAGRSFASIDLREHGSGNLGASNTFRFLGPKVAAGVLVCDIAKGFLPTFFAPAYAPGPTVSAHWLMLIAAFFTVIGHMFSVFVGFKGGKGIATTAGAFMALAPWAFLGAFIVWAIAFAATRIVSLGSILAALALPLVVYFTGRFGLESSHWSVLALSGAICIVVVVKHMSNIRRLMAGQEPALGRER
jgi:glycerol-3-phosphate acyltransferase PlsY